MTHRTQHLCPRTPSGRRTIPVLLALLSVLGCDAATHVPPPPPRDPPDFRFSILPGWVLVPPDREKTMAIALLNSTVWENADGLIKVDVEPPSLASAEEMA